jgi:pimeloyl-ACP methyl ester carboxylesterase
MVISDAAIGHPQVKALVYIAAFAPEQGESAFTLVAHDPGSLAALALVPGLYRKPDGSIGVETRLNPLLYRTVFVQDASAATAAQMAATQHPFALDAATQTSGPPAWKSIPSWYMVASNDRVIPPATERFMARRARSHTIEVPSSHAALVSHPVQTTRLILDAVAGS